MYTLKNVLSLMFFIKDFLLRKLTALYFFNPGYYVGFLGQVITSFDSEICQGGQSVGSCELRSTFLWIEVNGKEDIHEHILVDIDICMCM